MDHYHHTFIWEAERKGMDWLLINYRGVTHPLKNGIPFSVHDSDSFKVVIRDILR
jgi:hypothetical protein